MKAYSFHLKGIVQGVGFRPYVYRLAQEMRICGWVSNSGKGVDIHAEGAQVELFLERLSQELPPLAKVTAAERHEAEFQNYPCFEIRESEDDGTHDVLISPDVAICEKCRQDMKDAQNRRFQYPFTNCTNCGPRYTIIQDVPYDRTQTTMKDFPMCPDCAKEYQDPLDRRFHAQPVACSKCGPEVRLISAQGEELSGIGIEQLNQGAILAVKGLGGFHLVCDARNPQAVQRLRERKERGAKPFAVMARDLESIKEQLGISALEEKQLQSPAAPIVILERRVDVPKPLPEDIAPGLHTIGAMLPYTPLHFLLLDSSLDFLVMTSANLSGRPLIYQNEEAIRELQGIADYFLIHNRDIFHPCDDSVLQIIGEEVVFHRRARGYVPLPQSNPSEFTTAILGVGGELKNAFCLALGQRAFVSQYIGDMEGYENFQRFRQELASFQDVVQINPEVVAHDSHPNYQTTRFALASDWPQIKVQHHHAHLVSVLGEHARTKPTLGIICDGTGWGDDQKIWGFEFLKGNASHYERQAHLEYLPLPGGDAGAKSPLRIAYAYAKSLLSEDEWRRSERLWERLSGSEQRLLDQQLSKKIQVFETSSAGRLFDAVSALLDICTEVTYEGQAAIELEARASLWYRQNEGEITQIPSSISASPISPQILSDWKVQAPYYPIDLELAEKMVVLRVKRLFQGIIKDYLERRESGWIAFQFHDSVAAAIVRTVLELQGTEEPVVLSGGVFQNKLLTERILAYCTAQNIQVLRPRELPPGDGGLSYGQVLIANEVYKACV